MRKNEKWFKREDGYSEEDLLQYGIGHLASAKVLYETSFVCYDSAGYLAHLGIELMLKAIQLFHTDKFQKTHELNNLYENLKNNKHLVLESKHVTWLEELDKWNNEVRYPPSNTSRVVEVYTRDWNTVENLYNVLCNQMPEELQNKFKTIGSGGIVIDKEDRLVKGKRILMRRPKNIREKKLDKEEVKP